MPPFDPTVPYWLQTSEAAQTLAYTLLERYPAAFCADPTGVRPLKVGMHWDIAHALDVPRPVVREVLRRYTRRRAYRAACLVPGARRVDLDGQPVEPVALAYQRRLRRHQYRRWRRARQRRHAARAAAVREPTALDSGLSRWA